MADNVHNRMLSISFQVKCRSFKIIAKQTSGLTQEFEARLQIEHLYTFMGISVELLSFPNPFFKDSSSNCPFLSYTRYSSIRRGIPPSFISAVTARPPIHIEVLARKSGSDLCAAGAAGILLAVLEHAAQDLATRALGDRVDELDAALETLIAGLVVLDVLAYPAG